MSVAGTLSTIGRLMVQLKGGARRDVGLGVAAELLIIGLGIASPFGLKLAVDALAADHLGVGIALWGVAAFVAFWTATAILQAVKMIFTTRLSDVLASFMLVKALQSRLPLVATEKDVDTGRFQGVFERLPFSLRTIVEGLLWSIVPLALQVIVTVGVVACVVSLKYAALMFVVLAVHAIISYYTAEQYERQAMTSNQAAAALSSALSDLLRNAQRAVFNGAARREIARVGGVASEKRDVDVLMSRMLVQAAALQFSVIGLGIAALLVMGAFDVVAGGITLGDFVLLQAYVLNFATPIASYGFVLRQAGVAAANVDDALSYMSGEGTGSRDIQLNVSDRPAAITATNVHYAYKDCSVINGVELDIHAGAFAVIVGPNGSGKSTLARLLAGLLTPNLGTIAVGDQGPTQLQTGTGRNVLYVPQHVSLFSRSLQDNGLYPPTTLDGQKLKQVLEELSFYDDGREIDLDAEVGEHGNRLSGGQVQKLELARVSHINLPAIILDETTSALDAQSEQAVIDLLRQTRKEKSTLVLISHRIYAAESADLVVFMQGGMIRAQGAHATLMRSNADYRLFWAQQETEASSRTSR